MRLKIAAMLVPAILLSGCAGQLWPWQSHVEESAPGQRMVFKAPPMVAAPAPQALPDDAPKLDKPPVIAPTQPTQTPEIAPQAKPKKCHFWQRKCKRDQREQEKK